MDSSVESVFVLPKVWRYEWWWFCWHCVQMYLASTVFSYSYPESVEWRPFDCLTFLHIIISDKEFWRKMTTIGGLKLKLKADWLFPFLPHQRKNREKRATGLLPFIIIFIFWILPRLSIYLANLYLDFCRLLINVYILFKAVWVSHGISSDL